MHGQIVALAPMTASHFAQIFLPLPGAGLDDLGGGRSVPIAVGWTDESTGRRMSGRTTEPGVDWKCAGSSCSGGVEGLAPTSGTGAASDRRLSFIPL